MMKRRVLARKRFSQVDTMRHDAWIATVKSLIRVDS
jgi:hypothetical protein